MNIKGLFCVGAVALLCSCSSGKNATADNSQVSTTNSEKTKSIDRSSDTRPVSDEAKTVTPAGKATQVRYDR